jgi:uncharacterized membrane protein YfcA
MSYLVFLLLALICEVIGTVGGFGSSAVFVPLAEIFYDFTLVLALTSLFHLFSNAAKLILFRKTIDVKILLIFGLPSLIFTIAGALLTRWISAQVANIALGVFLVALSLLLLILHNFTFSATKRNSILGGSLAGFFAGLLGTGGAIRGIALSMYNLEKNLFVGTSAAIDMIVDSSRFVMYVINGFYRPHMLYYIPVMVLASFAGSYIGKLILAKVSQQFFHYFVLILILLIGIFTLIKVFLPFHLSIPL